ncbi:GAF domain-containing protein [Nocardioides sp. CF8]|uniref:GAF domain-containing sensor histidine kinase n=1 Tax=Nocardioides sp. CF8 TaxID=110319 RepID=UPI00032DB032|nr:GAF domain-containing protein [Nocardioides sp. CF8]EON24787.1 GAF domain-containing protein [Nocardioides sp. CF8]
MDEPGHGLHAVEFEHLINAVSARMHGALDEQARLKLLLDAVVTISADLSLDGVLSRIVAIASSLVDAQYAALGVLSASPNKRLRTFVHHGMDPDLAVEIGHLPEGHGLLGLIIDQPEPLRLHDIAQHPASYGFPDHHPPMKSFLGVPVRIRGRVFGNLYLTEKAGDGDFTAEDQEIVIALAAAAGVAIENARLYEEATGREAWLKATAEITALLSDPTQAEDPLRLVVDRAREVAGADVAWIMSSSPDSSLQVEIVSGFEVDAEMLGSLPVEDALARLVLEKGEPVSIEDVVGAPRALAVSGLPGLPDLGPAILVPMGHASRAEGVLAIAWSRERADHYYTIDAELPARFAEQAALALQVAKAREDQRRLALFEDRDRIGRDLHDLVIQRLFAVGLGLQGAARLSDQPEVAERLERAVDDLDSTIKDIRRAIFGLGALESAGDVQSEITSLVDRAASTLKFRPSLRFEGPVRTVIDADVVPHLLAVLGEALANASRHSEATAVEVVLSAGDEVSLVVRDNGRGLSGAVAESGLANIRHRAEQCGGTFDVESGAGEGTTLRWAVPTR